MTQGIIRKIKQANAFTIIEMLIVIGILSVIIVSLLIVLNPVDAQRQARDAKRLKDMYNIQAILQQYFDDDGSFGTACSTTTPCASSDSTGNVSALCSGTENWLGGIDVCKFSKTVPVDPLNDQVSRCVTGTGTFSDTCQMEYRVAVAGKSWEINMRLESTKNEAKVTGDSGSSAGWYENFNSTNALLDTANGG